MNRVDELMNEIRSCFGCNDNTTCLSFLAELEMLARTGEAVKSMPAGFKLIHHEGTSLKFFGAEWTLANYNTETTTRKGETPLEALTPHSTLSE